jgi:pyruvate dehydrogenase E1 component alpha subunit
VKKAMAKDSPNIAGARLTACGRGRIGKVSPKISEEPMAELVNAPVASPETLVDIYRRMIRIERNDDAIRKTIRLGRLTMPYYSARGQEVIPSAISTLLNKDDAICTIYRGIHDMVAKDMPLRPLWAEIAGRVDGACKGKGGPMHITHPETGVMVTTGIVGSSMPIANGLAWAAKLDGSQRVTVAYFGDGASYIGAFH